MTLSSVLILEDTPETLNWLRELTAATFEGADLVCTSRLTEAKAEVMQRSFNLAIVDLGLPDGSGLELIELIRQREQQTHILVATIYDDDHNLFEALRIGANGYILKDDPRETIASYLQAVVEQKPAISPRVFEKVLGHFHQQGEARRKSELTGRETEVLSLVAKGLNVAEVAQLLGLTDNTVKGYVKIIYSKLGISSRAEATAYAIRQNLIEI